MAQEAHPKLQSTVGQMRGVYTHYNRYHVSPMGGLEECLNAVVDREGVIQKIRGRTPFGDLLNLAISDDFVVLREVDQVIDWEAQKRLLVVANQWGGDFIQPWESDVWYDSDGAGTWVQFSTSLFRPDAMHKTRPAELRNGLYLTSLRGIRKFTILSEDHLPAGMPQGLDAEVSLVGTGGGVFTVDSAVAYRVLFGRKDSNGVTVLGAPGVRETEVNEKTTDLAWSRTTTTATITHTAHGYSNGDIIQILDSDDTVAVPNGSYTIANVAANTYDITVPNAGGANGTASDGKKFNINLDFSIPVNVQAGDFYQVYRSEFSTASSADPGDELFLVAEVVLAAGDITAKFATYSDTLDEAFLGLRLYTNETQEGALQENSPPPYAKDIAQWRGHLWFLNTKQPGRLNMELRDISGLSNTDPISFFIDPDVGFGGGGLNTYTAAAAENIAARQFQLFTTLPTSAQNIAATLRSLSRCINRDPDSDRYFHARYVSGPDDAPGLFEVTKVHIGQHSQVEVWSTDAAMRAAWHPALLSGVGGDLSTEEEVTTNGLMRSKFERAEAVPISNLDRVGEDVRQGVRILPLRDSLIVLLDKGAHIVTGQTDGASGASFSIDQLDPAVKIVAPDAAVVLAGRVIALSTQGVVQIDESGVVILSRPIEDEIRALVMREGFEEEVFAIGYESENRYILYDRPDALKESDTLPKSIDPHQWIYNTLTGQWTERNLSATAAVIRHRDDDGLVDALYEGSFSRIFRERKTGFSHQDVSLDTRPLSTVGGIGTTTNSEGDEVTTLTATLATTDLAQRDVEQGDVFVQGGTRAVIASAIKNSVNQYGLTLETLEEQINASDPASLVMAQFSRVRWKPEIIGAVNTTKQFARVILSMEETQTRKHTLLFSTNRQPIEVYGDVETEPLSGWGQGAWGEFVWGQDHDDSPSTPIHVGVPTTMQRAESLSIAYEHQRADEDFRIAELAIIARPYGDKPTIKGTQ